MSLLLSSPLVSALATSLSAAPLWALVAAGAVAALAVLVVWQNVEMRAYKGVRLPPSHVSWLPYGIDKVLARMTSSDHAFLDWTVKLYRTRGPMGMARIGGRTVIIANDPDCIKHILATNFDNYEKGALSRRIFQEFLGQGIFAADGHGWQTQRDTARVHFLREDLDSMVPAFARHGHVLTGILARHAASGEPADLQDLFLRFTMDSVAEILFGTPFSTVYAGERAGRRAGERARPGARKRAGQGAGQGAGAGARKRAGAGARRGPEQARAIVSPAHCVL